MSASEPLTGLLNLGGKFIDIFFESKEAKTEAKLKMMEMVQNGKLAELASETNLALGQIEVNKIEAANANLFVSGWRPAVGWVCVSGLFYSVLLQPVFSWVAVINGWPVPPSPDVTQLIGLLGGLLGFGGFRMFEKIKGVASK